MPGMYALNSITITLVALYILPAVVYCLRSGEGKEAKMVIALLNGIFNWTVIGWFMLMNVSLDRAA
jgi:hypothetical protein